MERVRRRWWTRLVTLGAGVVLTGAFLSALFQLLLLALPGLREGLADRISQEAGREVAIGGMHLGWRGVSPRLLLEDISLYPQAGAESLPLDPALRMERLALGFSWLRLIRGDWRPGELELVGLQLQASWREGRLVFDGLDTRGAPARSQEEWLRELERFDRVRVSRCLLRIEGDVDEQSRQDAQDWELIEARLDRESAQAHRLTASLQPPPGLGGRWQLDSRSRGPLAEPSRLQGELQLRVETAPGASGLPPAWTAGLREGVELGFQQLGGTLQAQWRDGAWQSAALQLQAEALVGGQRSTVLQLPRPALALSAEAQPGGWRLTRVDLSSEREGQRRSLLEGRLQLAGGRDAPRIGLTLDRVDLDTLAPWLGLARDPRWQRLGHLQGELRGVVAQLQREAADRPWSYALKASLQELGYHSVATPLAVYGISGALSATERGGQLVLAPSTLTLSDPRVFSLPLPVEALAGQIDWQREAGGWRLSSPQLDWRWLDNPGQASIELQVPDDLARSPEIRLRAAFRTDALTRLKPWMPLHWGQGLRRWLERGLQGGRLREGQLTIEGPLRQFPFLAGEGRFALDLDLDAVSLRFHPQWPPIEDLEPRLAFRGNGLRIEAARGRLGQIGLRRLQAEIADFRAADLAIDAELAGEGSAYYRWLRGTPLAERRLAGLLRETALSGPTTLDLQLQVPLRDTEQTRASGTVRLQEARLDLPALGEPLEAVSGAIRFDGSGVRAEGVQARLLAEPLTVDLIPLAEGAVQLRARTQLRAEPAGQGLGRYLPGWLRRALSGVTPVELTLDLGRPPPLLVDIRSTLEGLALQLPAPLDKPAERADALRLQLAPQGGGRLGLELAYADLLELRLQLEEGGRLAAGQIQLGPLAPEARPPLPASGLTVAGQVARLDLGGWMEQLLPPLPAAPGSRVAASPAASPLRLQSADLQVQELIWGARRVRGVQGRYRPEGAGWQLDLDGAGAAGQLRHDGSQLLGRLQRLHLEPLPNPPRPLPAEPGPPRDPAQWPLLDLRVEDLRLGAARLGLAELVSERIERGQRLSRARLSEGAVRLQAEGRWQRGDGPSSAALAFDLQGSALAEVMAGLGFAANISARDSHFRGDLRWSPAEEGLRWSAAEGPIELEAEDGSLQAVEPGAGRVLGLLNFAALPRRLIMDFRDVVGRGLAFDRLQGRFDLADGQARTDSLEILGPSLRMSLRGRVGLRERDYDQLITVTPDTSSGVTLGAILLGGPAAGLIALLAQEVLESPLDQAARLRYRVTGPWEDPQVQRLDDPPDPPATPLPAPEGPTP